MQENSRNEHFISLDVSQDRLSGRLWQIFPDATKMQHQVLRTFFIGLTTHLQLRGESLTPEAYPNNQIKMKAKLTSTTDGSVYMAIIGSDDIEYMKITITKDTVNRYEIGEGGLINLYQNPKNKGKQVNKIYAELPNGWEVIKVYEIVRESTFDIMAIFVEDGLYSRLANPDADRVIMEVSYRQKPTDLKSIKGENVVHDTSNDPSPINVLQQYRENNKRPGLTLPETAHRIRLKPTIIPMLPQTKEVGVTTDGRTVKHTPESIQTSIVKRTIESGEPYSPVVIEDPDKDVKAPMSIVNSILISLVEMLEFNRKLELPSNVAPERQFFGFNFGALRLKFGH